VTWPAEDGTCAPHPRRLRGGTGSRRSPCTHKKMFSPRHPKAGGGEVLGGEGGSDCSRTLFSVCQVARSSRPKSPLMVFRPLRSARSPSDDPPMALQHQQRALGKSGGDRTACPHGTTTGLCLMLMATGSGDVGQADAEDLAGVGAGERAAADRDVLSDLEGPVEQQDQAGDDVA